MEVHVKDGVRGPNPRRRPSGSLFSAGGEGKMTMVGMFAAGTTYEVTGKGFDPEVGEVRREDGRDGRNDLGVKSNLLADAWQRRLWGLWKGAERGCGATNGLEIDGNQRKSIGNPWKSNRK